MPNVTVVTDCSGSMNELGKPLLLEKMLRLLTRLASNDPSVELCFFSWNDVINRLEVGNGGESFTIKCTSKADPADLACFFDDLLSSGTNEGSCLALVLSDGRFSEKTIAQYETWKKRAARIQIRTIFIGVDAEEEKLKRLSTNSMVYASEDIHTALESLLFSQDSPVRGPVSLSGISRLGEAS